MYSYFIIAIQLKEKLFEIFSVPIVYLMSFSMCYFFIIILLPKMEKK